MTTTVLAPLNPTDFPGHPATPWDLAAFTWAAVTAKTLTSTWLLGANGQVTAERAVDFDRNVDAKWTLLLTDPTGDDKDPITFDLDFRSDPDKAARHLIHDDGLGLTMRDHQGQPYAIYRLPEGKWAQYTPVEMYAQDDDTYTQIVAGLRNHGVDAHFEWLDDGIAAEIHDPTDPTRAYQVYGQWLSNHDPYPTGWTVMVGQRVDDDALRGGHYFDFWTNENVHDLRLPLDAPVDEIITGTLALLTRIAPGALTIDTKPAAP